MVTDETAENGMKVTHYELWIGRKPNIKYFHVFGSICYILADREQRQKLYPKSDEGIFLGYSIYIRDYHVFINREKSMIDSINSIVNHIQSKVITNED